MDVYKVKIYPAAKRDLQQIVDYLNTLSAQAALRYYDLLVEQISSLSHMPFRCPRPRDAALAAKGYRNIWCSMLSSAIPYRSAAFCTPEETIKASWQIQCHKVTAGTYRHAPAVLLFLCVIRTKQLQSQQRSLQERGQRVGDGSKVYHFPAS